jgi:methyl-accepting chemotaxis protein
MFSNWSVGRRLLAGFGLAALALVVVAVVGYRNITSLIDNDHQVDHSHLVQTELAILLSQMKDAETGQRGFLLTGADSYLEPYESALHTVPATYDAMLKLTVDNPSQQARLAQIKPQIDSKLAELKLTIDLRRSEGFEAALKVVMNNTGKAFMDQIRSLVAEADREEAALLKKRADEAQAGADETKAIIVWGGVIGVVAVAAIGWFITMSLTEQIGGAVGRVQSSSTELQSAANQQAVGAKEQATALTEISTTITELLATSRQIAESAQRVAQNADQTANSARIGHGTVDQTNESILGIRRQVDQIVAHMLELGRKSQEIGAVLDIVAELSEQTNILAINATIEAAGAGEAGKRFAVVADEIRKLADRVGGSTKEIRTLIDDVRSAVNTTVMATETGSKAVDAGSRLFTDVATAFKQIAALVVVSTEAAREIELSTKQQTTAVEQVNLAVANVAQASVETETSAGQILQTVSQLAALSHDLLRIIKPQSAA